MRDKWQLSIAPESNGVPILIACWNGTERHRAPCDPRRPSECSRFTRELIMRCPAMAADGEIMSALEGEYARVAAEWDEGHSERAVVKPVQAIESYIPFPTDCLPDVLRRFMCQGAAAIQCDPAAIALPLLAGLASAIGNSRRIRLKATWSEPAVLWVVVVARSGTKKSPPHDLALCHITARQKSLLREYVRALARYKDARQEWKQTPKDIRGDEPQPPEPCQHIMCSDVTVEALAVRLEATPRGILLARDELAGWLASFDQYKGGKGADVSHWLEMHRAGPMKVDRKGGEKTTIYIPHAAVSICGTIQPGTLRRAFQPEYIENGLAARFLVASPPERMVHWNEDGIDAAVANQMEGVFDALYTLRGDSGLDGREEPREIDLDDGAKAAWIEFYEQHQRELKDLLDDALRAAHAKLEAYAARLALVIHCVRQAAGEPGSDFIDAGSIRAGVTLARWFENEARRIYGVLSETEEQAHERKLLDWLHQHGGRATVRELMRAGPCYRTAEDAEAALMLLVNSGKGRWEDREEETGRGRPRSRVFVLFDTTDTDKNGEFS